MLILTRRVGESIIIDGNIRVTVLATKGNQLRLGIDAPSDIEVHREEIFERIHGALDSGNDNGTTTSPKKNAPKDTDDS